MKIQHNVAAMNAYRNFGVNNSKLSKNLEKLSSGYAINRAGDDAAGLAVSEKMRMQISGLDASIKNAKDGVAMVQTAEGAYTEIHDMLNRMYYLVQQGINGTYSDTDRSKIGDELSALKAEISRICDSTQFNGKTILNGTQFTVSLGSNSLTFSADSVTASIPSGNTFANSDLTAISGNIDTVSTSRAKLGAVQNRLEHTINNLSVTKENMTQAESTLRDTDMAEEMMKFTKNNIMNQAAQAMLAQANQTPQSVLSLLQ
jgi:flagellin